MTIFKQRINFAVRSAKISEMLSNQPLRVSLNYRALPIIYVTMPHRLRKLPKIPLRRTKIKLIIMLPSTKDFRWTCHGFVPFRLHIYVALRDPKKSHEIPYGISTFRSDEYNLRLERFAFDFASVHDHVLFLIKR